MTIKRNQLWTRVAPAVACVAAFVLGGALFSGTDPIAAQDEPPKEVEKKPAQKRFETPKKAVEALLALCRKFDEAAMLDLFGHAHKDVIVTSDPSADRARIAANLSFDK